MYCLKSCPREEFPVALSFGVGVAKQSCLRLAGTGLLVKSIVTHGCLTCSGKTLEGWWAETQPEPWTVDAGWVSALYPVPQTNTSPPALQFPAGASHWLKPIRSQRARKPSHILQRSAYSGKSRGKVESGSGRAGIRYGMPTTYFLPSFQLH